MKQMTSKERLLAAIKFQGPDRVPVSPRMWRYLLKQEGSMKHDVYIRYAASHGLDPLLCTYLCTKLIPDSDFKNTDLKDVSVSATWEKVPDGTVLARTFETPAGTLKDRTIIPTAGGEFGIAPNPHIAEHLVKGPEDLDALQYVVDACVARMPGVIDYKARSAEIGGNGLLAAGIYSCLSHNAGDAYAIENFMVDCLVRPDFIHRLLDIFHRPILARLKQGLEAGAEMVYCSTFFESMSSGWSPAIYREFFIPRLKEQVDLAHEYGVLYHHYDDGKVRESLPMIKKMGADLVSTICPPPSGDVTPGQAREIAGEDLCLNGGIDTVNLIWRGTPEAIDRAVKEAIEQAALPEGGYIVGSSDSISEEVTPENFDALFSAVLKYGQTKAACC